MNPGEGSENVAWTPDVEDNVSYATGGDAGTTGWTDAGVTMTVHIPGDGATTGGWIDRGLDLIDGLLIETEDVFFADINGVRIILEGGNQDSWGLGDTDPGTFVPGDAVDNVTW